ncbi:copper resistance system multicopper oxidase [Hydrocarboniclastica marina]|uniref:Copper resistance system multicopper oxidase n=1 Tax=Hydrocarboniclastica marina TaxID=2259620 RepID=A0A4P7XH17_9ALTE|nr:copper resistance system multicopper oxidase [Hydrocarboniclastica marina]QCF26025.1 copper resistance system multicopper oxidase [Hydrocarboniclastica marina]
MNKQLVAGLFFCLLPAVAIGAQYDITVDKVQIDTGDFVEEGIGYNGASPGPTLRFKEGEVATINVTNNLDEMTSVHWHGLILPFEQDGVPGISFPGIKPGETFTYEFPIAQAGTYWFHSHSGFQEPNGAYGAIVIEPEDREPFRYDRDYVVQLTDKHPHSGDRIMRNLKTSADYYNRHQQTVGDFIGEAAEQGFFATLKDRLMWGGMRMMKADVEDVQGFTGLINGKGPAQNWTGLFKPGERVRLRFINSSAMTYFDVRIPGLEMTVVQADGNNVQPVTVDEFRIGVAETYDVIVRIKDEKAYTIFAESMGRSGYARGTLAPEEGMEAQVPELREAPLLTMADMAGHMDHQGMDHEAMGHPAMNHEAMDHAAMGQREVADEGMNHEMAGMDHAGMGHSSGNALPTDPFYASGSGLSPVAANGGKFLSYSDLKAQHPLYEERDPTREIELRLTGNMERYEWSINGIKYEHADPIVLQYGERVRFKFVNETMMTHPMHLHGMWSILDVGEGKWNPLKHVISVAPATTVYMETEVDAPGEWAFHCHLSYHAAAGMFRKIVVEGGPEQRGGNS